jgi:hypothetical protein
MRRFLVLAIFVSIAGFVAIAADKDADTPKAAATRKRLQQKISVNYKDTLFRDVRDDLKEKVEGLGVLEDLKGGVNLNLKVTYKADDETLERILNAICDKYDMGYYVISQQNTGYDGSIKFTRNKEQRGFESGKSPDKAAPKDKDNPKDKEAQKDKSPGKDKAVNKEKSEEKPKNEKPAKETEPEDEVQKAERQAALKLAAIKGVIEDGKPSRAIELCEELLKKFPGTKAAKEAKELLEKLK